MKRGAVIALAIGALAVLFLSFAAGWATNGWRLGKQISDIQRDHLADMTSFATAATTRLADAIDRGNKLQLKLNDEELARLQTTQEKDREIRRLTTGRRCLDAAAVRLLNAAGSSAPGAVPQAPSSTDGPDAGFATDTDVGTWANQCRSAYDTCRGRLRAVAEFFQGMAGE